MKSFLKLIFLPLLSVGLFIFVYINNIQPKLGLDLQGGVSVILTAEEGTDPELIEQAVEITVSYTHLTLPTNDQV